jgi:uncharacterized membrane protein YccC
MTNSYGEPFPAYEDMLRAILKDNPHREVKGAETVALADCVASTFAVSQSVSHRRRRRPLRNRFCSNALHRFVSHVSHVSHALGDVLRRRFGPPTDGAKRIHVSRVAVRKNGCCSQKPFPPEATRP